MADLILPRRGFLTGLVSLVVAAPAIVRADSLMRVVLVPPVTLNYKTSSIADLYADFQKKFLATMRQRKGFDGLAAEQKEKWVDSVVDHAMSWSGQAIEVESTPKVMGDYFSRIYSPNEYGHYDLMSSQQMRKLRGI